MSARIDSFPFNDAQQERREDAPAKPDDVPTQIEEQTATEPAEPIEEIPAEPAEDMVIIEETPTKPAETIEEVPDKSTEDIIEQTPATPADAQERIASLTIDADYSFTKPISVAYKGTVELVDTWQSVYFTVCKHLYEDEKAEMLYLVRSNVGGLASHYADERTKDHMQRPKEFAPGCYFEAGLSATDIMQRIRKLLEHLHVAYRFEIRYRATKEDAQTADAEPVVPEQPKQPAPTPSPLQVQVEHLVKNADLAGMTIDDLRAQIPDATTWTLKRVRDSSAQLVNFNDTLVHVDSFVDWDDAAQKLDAILQKLLDRNDGYTTCAQLYQYAEADMRMFLNDNDLDDKDKLFAMAQHLFEKVGYNGRHYYFRKGVHISRGERAINSFTDVARKFAREQNGFFCHSDLNEYLEQRGLHIENWQSVLRLHLEPTFFCYATEEYISAESMQIDDAWLEQAKKALERLFDDQGDHVVLRAIHPNWFALLPPLPANRPWTALLLQYVLLFYGEKLNARTIKHKMKWKYDALHAMLAKRDSEVQTFADAIVAHLVDNGIKERHFLAGDLRKELVEAGLLGNNELIQCDLSDAIGKDERFLWDSSYEHVTIRV